MPLQVNRSVSVSGTVSFCPAMWPAWLFMPDLDETEFFLQLRIAHDFVTQRSAAGCDHLNDRLHCTLASAGNGFFCNVCFVWGGKSCRQCSCGREGSLRHASNERYMRKTSTYPFGGC